MMPSAGMMIAPVGQSIPITVYDMFDAPEPPGNVVWSNIPADATVQITATGFIFSRTVPGGFTAIAKVGNTTGTIQLVFTSPILKFTSP